MTQHGTLKDHHGVAASFCLCCSAPRDHNVMMEADRGHETGSQRRQKEKQHGARSHDSGVYVKERSPQLCRWILVAFVVVVLLFCVVASASRSFLLCFTDWSQRKLLSLFAFPVCSSRLPFLPRVFCTSTCETSVTPRLFGFFFCLCQAIRKSLVVRGDERTFTQPF